MKLGVDVDGVVLDSVPLYQTAFEKHGRSVVHKNAYRLQDIYDTSPEITQTIMHEVEQITDVPLIPGAQILNKIVDLPHIESPIYFVSSRSLESWMSTKQALKRHFPFNFYLTCDVDKGWFCAFQGLDFFVEDGPPHIRDIFYNSITRLYILDKPYNQEIDFPHHMNALRVKNWDEILIDIQREGYREAIRVSKAPHNL